jgi:hypothetical protein
VILVALGQTLTNRGLYHGPLQIHNLLQMNRFSFKLVSFILSDKNSFLDKHASLLHELPCFIEYSTHMSIVHTLILQ